MIEGLEDLTAEERALVEAADQVWWAVYSLKCFYRLTQSIDCLHGGRH